MPEGKERKIYASAVLTIATLDTAVFEIGAFAKWLLKIFIVFFSGFWLTLIQRNIQLNAKPLLKWLPLVLLFTPKYIQQPVM